MQDWIGPAIIAAVISGLVSLVIVQLNFRQSRAIERLQRAEKVRDFQIALRAEIASDLLNMQVVDRGVVLDSVQQALGRDPAHIFLVPRLASNRVFEAIADEIHVLPAAVITPVVDYARLRQTLDQFIDDMRSEVFGKLDPDRRLLMYSDYLATFGRLEALALVARDAIDASLSRSAADR